VTDLIFTEKTQPGNVKGYKNLNLDDGRVIKIPIMKTPEELYGPAHPAGIVITDEDIKIANSIIANNTTSGTPKERMELLISYLRLPPSVMIHPPSGDLPAYSTIGVGTPNACLVAFKFNNALRLGWSMLNSSGEPIPYSNKKARMCAVLRGMKDSITMEGKKFGTNSQRKVVPVTITKNLKKFTDRAERYFKCKFDNYFPNYIK